jgi:uncharacterized protein (DUF2252 family)
MMETRSDRRRSGKAIRQETPLRSHSEWTSLPDRPDPLQLLQEQDRDRLQHLLPKKYGRMAASPFAFLRGSAAVMAADLAATPSSGLVVQLCGDAHLSNFGVFATPERKLVFDINDFDETHPGPWEWDVKRLAASAVVAGRESGYDDKINRKLAQAVVETYAKTMRKLSKANTMDIWYFHVEAESVLSVFERSSKETQRSAEKMVSKARRKTQRQTLEQLTTMVDGKLHFKSDPPLLVPLDELLSEDQKERITIDQMEDTWNQYLDSLSEERRVLLSRFRLRDAALRVGGVGSVGTRCTILLFEGVAKDDAIILQQKEAGPSVLEIHTEDSIYLSPAKRVVIGQRLMQASSDIFLGWHQSGLSGTNYYWRQLKDMKGSLDVTTLDAEGIETYLRVCALSLARAHARTGEPDTISGYNGGGKVLSRAIADFALAYADQTERDHQALVSAI